MHVPDPITTATPRGFTEGLANPRRRWVLVSGPVLLATAMGCGSGTPAAQSPVGASGGPQGTQVVTAGVVPAEATPAEDESMADLREHHLHHHGGFAMFVAMSLDLLNATPEQSKAITKIQAALDGELRPTQDAERSVLLVLAEGTAAGNIDRARVDADIGQVTTAAVAVRAAVADSLNQLHATLTPLQRAALVDKIDAHFSVWREVNAPDASGGEDAYGGRLGRLTRELGLSPDQIAKVHAGLRSWTDRETVLFDRQATEDYLKAFDRTFVGDVFDARTLGTGTAADANIAAWGAARMASYCETLTPLLTRDQRERLADSLLRHANYKRALTGT